MLSIFDKKCRICKRKINFLRKYKNDKCKKIKVCLVCSIYAERRAYRKVKLINRISIVGK